MGTSFSDTGLGDASPHSYVVAAIDANGKSSPFSAVATTTTAPGQPAPTVTAKDQTNGELDIAWSATTGGSTYVVSRAGTPIYSNAYPGGGFVADTGRGDNTTLSYTVTAVDSNGVHSAAGSASGTTVPAIPTLTVTTPQAPATVGTLGLSWTASPGATSYVIQRKPTSGGSFATITPTSTGATSANDVTGLSDSTGYDYQVRAVNSASKSSAFSPTASGTTTPPQVTGFTATAAGASSINLAWTAVGGTASISYRIFRGTSPGVSITGSPALTVSGASSNSATDSGLSQTTTYYYVIVARDTGKTLDGPASAEKNATTQSAAAGSITVAPVPNALSVGLNWASVAGATGYGIQRLDATQAAGVCGSFTSHAGGWADVPGAAALGSGAVSFTDSDAALAAGHTYCYVLVPVGANPSTPQSGILAAPPPSSLTAALKASDTQGLTITVNWSYGAVAPSGTPTLTFYRCNAAGTSPCTPTTSSTQVKQISSPGASGTFDDTGLSPGNAYYYLGLGSNTSGAYSATALIRGTASGPSVPTGASALAGAAAGKNNITVSWTKVSDNSASNSYLVFRGSTAGSYPDFGTGAGTSTICGTSTCTYVDDNSGAGLANGATFHYVVKATSSTFASAASSDVFATTAAPSPTSLTATATIPGGNRQIALTWGAASGATSYDIYRGTSAGVALVTPYQSSISATNYTDTSVAAGTTYFYKVTVHADTSRVSNEANAVTAPGAPTFGTLTVADGDNPNPPSGCGAGQHCVVVPWSPPSNAANFNLYRRPFGGSFGPALATGLTGVTYTDNTAAQDTVYEYVIEASNTGGTGPQSGLGSATTLPVSFNTLAAVPSTDNTSTSTARRITLSWSLTGGTHATGVWIYRVVHGGSFDFTSPITTNASSPFIDNTVAADTNYDYVGRAGISGVGVSASSSNTVTNKLTLPDAPVVSFVSSTNVTTADCTTSPSCIVINWPALPADVTGYALKGSTSGSTFSAVAGSASCAAGTCKYVEQGLSTGQTRYYQVQGVNATGTGPIGAIPTGSNLPPSTPPAAVGSLFATGGIGQVSLTWGPSNGASQYKIERKLTSGGSYGAPIIVTGTNCVDAGASPGSPNCSLGALTNGQSYDYRVTAQVIVTGGVTLDGDPSTVTAQVIPSTPTGLTAARIASGTVRLQFNSSSCATSYDLLQSTTGTGGSFVLATPSSAAGLSSPCTNSGTVTADVSGLTDGATYYFEVSARNFGSTGTAASASAPTSPAQVTLQPQAPTNLVATGGNGLVSLTWTGSSGASSYNLYRGGSKITSGLTGTSTTDNAVTNGTTYTYQLTAVNGGGESGFSNSSQATPQAATVQAPGSVSAVGLNGAMRVLWNEDAADTGSNGYTYTVVKRTGAGVTSGETAVSGCTNVTGGTGLRRSCVVTGLTNHSTYYFVVRATFGGTDSVDSAEASASAARELCMSVPQMSAVVAIDADTVISSPGPNTLVDVVPRRWFGNVTQVAQPSGVAVDQTNDRLFVSNYAAGSINVYSPRTSVGNGPPLRSITGTLATLVGGLPYNKLYYPLSLAFDATAQELYVVNVLNTGATSIAVFNATDSGVVAPKRLLLATGLNTVVMGPGSTEFTVTNGTGVSVYSRTWSGNTPVPLRTFTVTGTSSINALAIDTANSEIWVGDKSLLFLAAVPSSSSSTSAITPTRKFTLGATRGGPLSLALDPIGSGTSGSPAPELVIGTTKNTILGLPRTTNSNGPTPAYIVSGNNSLLSQPAGLAIDSGAGVDYVWVASSASDLGRQLDNVSAYTRRQNTSTLPPQVTLVGPYQAGGVSVVTDEPRGLAGTSPLTSDELWVTNHGLPGGDSSNTLPSETSVYSMTGSSSTPSSLAALDNSLFGPRGEGVSLNTAADEVYVSDGSGSVGVYYTTGTCPSSGSPAPCFQSKISNGPNFDLPYGLFWDASSSQLYVAEQGVRPSDHGKVTVWLRNASDGSFPSTATRTFSSSIASPVGVAVAGTTKLWVANSDAGSQAGPGAARFNLSDGAFEFYYANDSTLPPAAIVADSTNVFLGNAANLSSDRWGVTVLTGATSGSPAAKGHLVPAGVTHSVGGLNWCN
ncbi:MAG: hypothetical protein JST92_01875 [Deltaproteobacteria bacterium]|nr:hypothetical protein [Deltaproteobacteria bacterium]